MNPVCVRPCVRASVCRVRAPVRPCASPCVRACVRRVHVCLLCDEGRLLCDVSGTLIQRERVSAGSVTPSWTSHVARIGPCAGASIGPLLA